MKEMCITCAICGARWPKIRAYKLRPGRYICGECYKKIFVKKEVKI